VASSEETTTAPSDDAGIQQIPSSVVEVLESPSPEIANLGLIPVTDVTPDDVGTLALTYTNGEPVLTLSAGTGFPSTLRVVDESGSNVALYTGGPALELKSRSEPGEFLLIILTGQA
jgi:hypothetical protein